MTDMWTLENMVLAGCYLVGAGAAAATAAFRTNRTQSDGNTANNMPHSRRRGKPRKKLQTGEDSRSCSTNGSSAPSSFPPGLTSLLPMCPLGGDCTEINEPDHFTRFRHVCRLQPCHHAHLDFHRKYFVHEGDNAFPFPNLCLAPSSESSCSRQRFLACPSDVSSNASGGYHQFISTEGSQKSFISPNVPNASQISIVHGATSFFIWGDWSRVRLHTLKRYLHQVTGVNPNLQSLVLVCSTTNRSSLIDDEFSALTAQGLKPHDTIRLNELAAARQ